MCGKWSSGRDEWALAKPNAEQLLIAVNGLLGELNLPFDVDVSSGFRPNIINAAQPRASKNSLHIRGLAIDLADPMGKFKALFDPRHDVLSSDLLRKYELFMEHPAWTQNWVHLDMGNRPDRPMRVFIP